MSVFKFPGEGNVIFHCKISLCDMTSDGSCIEKVPPRCGKRQPVIAFRERRSTDEQLIRQLTDQISPIASESLMVRSRRNIVPTKDGFHMTLEVETRTLNVLLGDNIRPETSVKYCDIS
ncbi:hypothetical protein KIN20_029059 [Parelaphostrongylus tenuis]|uniref:ZP domain-containing protein n=1 Tax=Parelaphostrongylus tenuis TaxID=148309 RepID=A0AAD5R1X9_PARTN|nr:hypothetical protein KIN20_029059 [Parelaphostrongylus tenuis]